MFLVLTMCWYLTCLVAPLSCSADTASQWGCCTSHPRISEEEKAVTAKPRRHGQGLWGWELQCHLTTDPGRDPHHCPSERGHLLCFTETWGRLASLSVLTWWRSRAPVKMHLCCLQPLSAVKPSVRILHHTEGTGQRKLEEWGHKGVSHGGCGRAMRMDPPVSSSLTPPLVPFLISPKTLLPGPRPQTSDCSPSKPRTVLPTFLFPIPAPGKAHFAFQIFSTLGHCWVCWGPSSWRLVSALCAHPPARAPRRPPSARTLSVTPAVCSGLVLHVYLCPRDGTQHTEPERAVHARRSPGQGGGLLPQPFRERRGRVPGSYPF